ncbi:MAG: SAM-dependent methyltransferase [Bacteroidota bacterium]
MTKGKLFLIPTLLSDSEITDVLPQGVINHIHRLSIFAVEKVRTARRFLIKTGIPTPVDDLEFIEFSKHSGEEKLMDIVMRLVQGQNIGLLSESGVPCIADPGAILVEKAHEFQIPVIPLTGPSSILLGLMASGFSGQKFSFHGYLPIDDKQRDNKLKFLEKLSSKEDQTQMFIETPYRNIKMFNALLKVCASSTKLSIAVELTGKQERIFSHTISEWKNLVAPPIHKQNVIFSIYAPSKSSRR